MSVTKAAVIAALVQLPFLVLLNLGPHSGIGFPGMFFYFIGLLALGWWMPDLNYGGHWMAIQSFLFIFEGSLLMMILLGVSRLRGRMRENRRAAR